MGKAFDLVLLGNDDEPVLEAPVYSVTGYKVACHLAMEACEGIVALGEDGGVAVVDNGVALFVAVAHGGRPRSYDEETWLERLPLLVDN